MSHRTSLKLATSRQDDVIVHLVFFLNIDAVDVSMLLVQNKLHLNSNHPGPLSARRRV